MDDQKPNEGTPSGTIVQPSAAAPATPAPAASPAPVSAPQSSQPPQPIPPLETATPAEAAAGPVPESPYSLPAPETSLPAPVQSAETFEPAASFEPFERQLAPFEESEQLAPVAAAPLSVRARSQPQEAEIIEPPQIHWRALEFIAHPKSVKWYAIFALVWVAIIVLSYLLLHDIITVVVFAVCALISGYVAARPPRELDYGLGTNGIYIGNKFYPYHDFNAFAIVDEGIIASIDFMPLKRFAPVLSIACDPEQETSVLDILTQHLPVTQHQRGAIDGFMHRIHF